MKSKKVLIVDNNDLNRKLFETLIGQLYSFVAVKKGVEAVNRATREKFDLILMDIQMPEIDGITAFKTIRRQAFHHCPIIATTSYSDESARKYFLEIGFDDLITKPIHPNEFLEVISTLINSICNEELKSEEVRIEIGVLDKAVLQQLLKYNRIETIRSIYFDFLEEFDLLTGQIDAALQGKNQQVLIEILHTLKGNSGTLGANAIFTLISDADLKVRKSDWNSLEPLLKKLKNERIMLERYLGEETTFKP